MIISAWPAAPRAGPMPRGLRVDNIGGVGPGGRSRRAMAHWRPRAGEHGLRRLVIEEAIDHSDQRDSTASMGDGRGVLRFTSSGVAVEVAAEHDYGDVASYGGHRGRIVGVRESSASLGRTVSARGPSKTAGNKACRSSSQVATAASKVRPKRMVAIAKGSSLVCRILFSSSP